MTRKGLRRALSAGIFASAGLLAPIAAAPASAIPAHRAAAPRGETVNQWPWSVSAAGGLTSVSADSLSFTSTTGNVSAAMQVTSLAGQSASWRFRLLWRDHGRNKPVWTSPWYTAAGTHRSPSQEPTEGRHPKYLIQITVTFKGQGTVSAGGLSDIYLDYPDPRRP
jgi:hypothetical protein